MSEKDDLAHEKAVNEEVLSRSFTATRGITYGAMAHALSLSMHNSTSTQYAAQTLGNSAMASTCAKILAS